jgi:hypothetical protein
MASRIPALPRDSHVQSHATVHKNKLCDSQAPLVARAIAGGWTRPSPDGHEWPLRGSILRLVIALLTLPLKKRDHLREYE